MMCSGTPLPLYGEMHIFVRKYLGEQPLGRLKVRWMNSIEVDLMEVGCEDGKWIELNQYHIQWQSLLLWQ
jgi:hypothetical protein